VIISEKYKLVFITTPKSGSHTGFRLMETYFEPKPTSFNHSIVVPEKYKNYGKFTLVRNPYERFCALFHACVINDKKKFVPGNARQNILEYAKWMAKCSYHKNYIRKDLTAPQYQWHENSKDLLYIKIEQAQEIFNTAYPELNIRMPHELKRDHPTWKDWCTNELTHYVNLWANKDFDLYGYDKE
jgi:hypothetical protein